jgi:two-component system sensor histidine kinase KdpD
LAICKAIVEAHGGYIEAKSRSQGGAIFTIVLYQHGTPPSIEPEEDSRPEP